MFGSATLRCALRFSCWPTPPLLRKPCRQRVRAYGATESHLQLLPVPTGCSTARPVSMTAAIFIAPYGTTCRSANCCLVLTLMVTKGIVRCSGRVLSWYCWPPWQRRWSPLKASGVHRCRPASADTPNRANAICRTRRSKLVTSRWEANECQGRSATGTPSHWAYHLNRQ